MTEIKTFSIVVPVFQNQESLNHTVPELLRLQEKLPGYRLKLFFVDDGSIDDSYSILHGFYKEHPETISLIKLTKNFGQNQAILAGLRIADGDCFGIISADLQDPPELFIDMIDRWEQGTKLVIAERKGRKEGPVRNFFSGLYWHLLRKYAISGFPAGGFDFCLIDRRIKEELDGINEKNPVVFPLIFWLGFDHDILTYVRGDRNGGKSSWTLGKKIKLTVDTFVNFTYTPVKFISFMGIGTSLIAFLYALTVFFKWLFWGMKVRGWSTIIILISCFSGLILFSLGIIGEYLWRILEETRNRPNSIIDSITDTERNK